MNRSVGFIALAGLMVLCRGALAADVCVPTPGKRVAIMELKVTGDYCDQVKEWLPALIEDQLLREGWTLLVRGERMQHIQQELGLNGVNPDTAVPQGQLLGATAFIEMNARIQVQDIQGLIGYKQFTFGDFARASVDLTGQVVDPATGVLKSPISVGGSASGLKTALVISIAPNWRIGAAGYNLEGIRATLVGKAADAAALKLVTRLHVAYPTLPGQQPARMAQLQPSSTTVIASANAPTILVDLPQASACSVGDRFGIYRSDKQIAEVEIVRLMGKRGEARIVSQTGPIQPTDTARRIPMVIKAE